MGLTQHKALLVLCNEIEDINKRVTITAPVDLSL